MAFIPQELFGRGNEVDGSPSGYKTIYIPKQDDGIFSEFVNDYIDMFKKVEPELYEYIMKIEPRFPIINSNQYNKSNKKYGYPERRINPMNVHFHEYIVELKQFISLARSNREKEEIKQPPIVPVAELIDYNLIDFPPISVEVDHCGEIRMQSQQDIFKTQSESKSIETQTESKSIETQTESSEVAVSYSVGTWVQLKRNYKNTVIVSTFPNGIQIGSKVIHTFDKMAGPQVGAIVISIDLSGGGMMSITFNGPFIGFNTAACVPQVKVDLYFTTPIGDTIVYQISLEDRRIIEENKICRAPGWF
jgi:hypothetical protein